MVSTNLTRESDRKLAVSVSACNEERKSTGFPGESAAIAPHTFAPHLEALQFMVTNTGHVNLALPNPTLYCPSQ